MGGLPPEAEYLLLKDGGKTLGQIGYCVEGESAKLLYLDAPSPVFGEALVRAVLHAAELRGAKYAYCEEEDVAPLLQALGFVYGRALYPVYFRILFPALSWKQ